MQVSVSAGGAVTVVCQDGVPGRVAVPTRHVRVLIDASGSGPTNLALPLNEATTAAGGARVYSLAQGRTR